MATEVDRPDSDRTRVVFAVVLRMYIDNIDELKRVFKDLDASIVYQRLSSVDRRLVITEEGFPRDEVEGERRR